MSGILPETASKSEAYLDYLTNTMGSDQLLAVNSSIWLSWFDNKARTANSDI